MAHQDPIQEMLSENFIMCQKINRLIPDLCAKIKTMKTINQEFSLDLSLQVAEEYLNFLETMRPPVNIAEEKIKYVDEFQNHLGIGLRSLQDFFEGNVSKFKALTDEQRAKLTAVSAKIIMTQNSIINIVGH